MNKSYTWPEMFELKDRFEGWYEDNLYMMTSPTLYLGDEMNTVHFDWQAAYEKDVLEEHFKVALVDVNASGYAACSVAIRLFYQELHDYDISWIVERVFCPASDADAELLKRAGFPPLSTESHMPLSAFDVICCSQQMIGDEVNLIRLIRDAGIPVFSRDREDEDPFVIRGGASSFNPSLLMGVCDIFFMGEGEDILPELLAMIEKGRKEKLSREEILLQAAETWDCLWVPAFYEERFSKSGELLGMFRTRNDVPRKVRYAYVADMDKSFVLTRPVGIFNYASNIADGIEITRGCEGQCCFCVSGFTYMPFRMRSPEVVLRAMRERLYNSGEEHTTLGSFCGTSYPGLNELIRKIYVNEEGCEHILEGYPRTVATMSLRLDTVFENPEFCSFLTAQSNKRIVFGVEGISQRLRQSVSKNYTEEQILDTMRMVIRDGFLTIKLMFIASLPNETMEDWDELIALTEKILKICEEEGRTGELRPKLVYSWTPLKVFPLTPYQWLEARVTKELLPPQVRETLEGMGVIIGAEDLEGGVYDFRIEQLLLRGDSRLEAMLIDMAAAGICHHIRYEKEAEDFVRAWLKNHGLPDIEDWFGEKGKDDVFPWDFIDNGVKKEYLWKRYVESQKQCPKDSPRCLTRCSGCGACSDTHAHTMDRYRRRKSEDVKIPLGDISKTVRQESESQKDLSYAVIEFTYDEKHVTVKGFYWENELSRALNQAGIPYERKTVRVRKPYSDRYDWTVGINCALVGFRKQFTNEELLTKINEHTVNMKATDIRWIDGPKAIGHLCYQSPYPENTDEESLGRRLEEILKSDSWIINLTLLRAGREHRKDVDVRPNIVDLSIKDHRLVMKLKAACSPYHIFMELFGLSWEEAKDYKIERTQVIYA